MGFVIQGLVRFRFWGDCLGLRVKNRFLRGKYSVPWYGFLSLSVSAIVLRVMSGRMTPVVQR